MAAESRNRGGRRGAATLRAGIRRAITAVGTQVDRRVPGLRPRLTRGLTVFVFHEITDTPSAFQQLSDGYTSPDVFRRQIAWIGERFEFIAPVDLPGLGGRGPLPERAALITFDDAWAGVFEVGLETLRRAGVPALCFLNMATVAGTPDLSAVRRYERRALPGGVSRLDQPLDASSAPRVLAAIDEAYREDRAFHAFQGRTVGPDALAAAAEGGQTWFGSHLFHHWDLRTIGLNLFRDSLLANELALAPYDRTVPALATPYGLSDDAAAACAFESGVDVLFIATGRQNGDPRSRVLDRVSLDPEPSEPSNWWYATHRDRFLGGLAS